ncbi:hypothetical protein BH10PAT1_BH10PAT1_5750 [soil metagenome]
MTLEISTNQISNKEIAPGYEPTYHAFVSGPTKIHQGYEYQPYIEQEQANSDLEKFIKHLNPDNYDVIMIVEKAGWGLGDILKNTPGFENKTILSIEYHGNSHSTQEKKKIPVPDDYKNSDKVLIVDTLLDEGGTAKLIEEDCPNADFVFAYKKRDVKDQYVPKNSAWAGEIDNLWVFGLQTDIGTTPLGHPKDYGRNYPGIGVAA